MPTLAFRHVYSIINIDIDYYITYFLLLLLFLWPYTSSKATSGGRVYFGSQFEETIMFNHHSCAGPPPIAAGILYIIHEAGEKGRETLNDARRQSIPTPRIRLEPLHQRSNNSSTMAHA